MEVIRNHPRLLLSVAVISLCQSVYGQCESECSIDDDMASVGFGFKWDLEHSDYEVVSHEYAVSLRGSGVMAAITTPLCGSCAPDSISYSTHASGIINFDDDWDTVSHYEPAVPWCFATQGPHGASEFELWSGELGHEVSYSLDRFRVQSGLVQTTTSATGCHSAISRFNLRRLDPMESYVNKVKVNYDVSVGVETVDHDCTAGSDGAPCEGGYVGGLEPFRAVAELKIRAYDGMALLGSETRRGIVGGSGDAGITTRAGWLLSSDLVFFNTLSTLYTTTSPPIAFGTRRHSRLYVSGVGGPYLDFKNVKSFDGEPDLVVVETSACHIQMAEFGDINRTGIVRPIDRELLLALDGADVDADDYSPYADMDFDGDVDQDDLAEFDSLYCFADYNGDTEIDILDELAFLDDVGNESSRADLNEDAVIDVLDLLMFYDYYSAGCS